MQVSSQSANAVSRLCVRISKAEALAGITAPTTTTVDHPHRQTFMDRINILCQRIKRLEKLLGIKGSQSAVRYSLGPSGNALLANKLNVLCSRLARIEKVQASL